MKIKHQFSGKSLSELKEEFGMGDEGFWGSWWFNESFAKEKPPKGVYEIDFEKQLTNLTYDQQRGKLPKGFDFPHPAILAEAILVHYKKTRERLLEDWWSRTSVQSSDGYFVYVGLFDSDGLDVPRDTRDDTDSGLGVCPSRLVSRKLGELDTSLDSSVLDRLEVLEDKLAKILNIINI